ncbi:MAG: hypothetical protein GVY08_00590 [Bacteroidetes bacterium]|nr:hypothetical protein [Bacteroidota bacterium]
MTVKPLFIKLSLILSLLFVAAVADGFAFQLGSPDISVTDTTTQKFGSILFRVEPDTAYLYADRNYEDPVILTDSTMFTLPVGSHRFFIFGESIPERRMNLKVQENDTLIYKIQVPEKNPANERFSAYAAYKWNANVMVFSDEETLISVVNSDYFSYGSLRAKLAPGVHRVRFESVSGKSHEVYLEVNSYQLQTYDHYFKPKESNARVAGLIPGAAQLYKKETGKAVLVFGAVGLTTAAALHYNSRIADESQAFDRVLSEYRSSTNETRALELGNRLDRLDGDIQTLNRNRNIFRAAAVLLYAANIVDAFRAPKGGFARSRTFDPFRDFSVGVGEKTVKASFQFHF